MAYTPLFAKPADAKAPAAVPTKTKGGYAPLFAGKPTPPPAPKPVPPPAPPAILSNPFGIHAPGTPAPPPVVAPSVPAPAPVAATAAPIAPSMKIAPGPRISALPKAPTAPIVPTGVIKAPEPGFMDKPGFIQDAYKSLKGTFEDTVQRGVDLSNAVLPSATYNPDTKQYEMPKVTPGQRTTAMVRAGVGAINLSFAPISALLKGAEGIDTSTGLNKYNPALVTTKLAAKAVGTATQKVGEAGSYVVGKGFEQLPQTPGVQQFKAPAQEVGGLLAVLLVGKVAHETVKLPQTVEEFKNRTIKTNDIVTSAAKVLDVPTETDVLGRVKKVDPETVKTNYRQAAHEAHPDRGGSAQEFQVVSTAKNILEDFNTMKPKDFAAKYQTPLEAAQRVIKQIPAQTESTSPKYEPLFKKSSAGETVPTESTAVAVPEPAKVPVTAETPSFEPPVTPSPTSVTNVAPETPVQPALPIKMEPPKPVTPPTPTLELPKGQLKLPPRPTGEPVAPSMTIPKAAGTPKITLKDTPLHNRIMGELIGAEAGKRFAVEDPSAPTGLRFTGSKSSFPDWIPKELRRKPILEAVSRHIEAGTMPTKAAEVRLYKVVHNEMNAMDEVLNDQKFVQAQRANLYDPFASEAENAANLARFDYEYAKLKEQSGSPQAGGTEVQPVGEPIPYHKESAVAPVAAEAAPVTPRAVLPGAKQSTVGKSIEAKTIEKHLAASFSDTAQYDPITIKDQAKRAADLMNTDIERAKRIVRGQEKMPDGLLGGTMIKAMEDYALRNNDAQLALDIANSPLTSETSIHAQEMRVLAERDPDSAVAALQRLKQIKEETATKRTSIKKEEVVKEIKDKIKKEKPKATKQTWGEFIDSITC